MKPATFIVKLKGRRRGVSLLFALIALLALSMAAIALVRSVDTGTVVLGNLGFKQEATAAADQVTQQAIVWLKTNSALLNTSATKGTGYYAAYVSGLDPTGRSSESETRALVDWDGDNCKSYSKGVCTLYPAEIKVTDSSKGLKGLEDKKAQFIIIRLCSTEGATDASGNTCATAKTVETGTSASQESSKRGELSYTDTSRLKDPIYVTTSASAYYRIIVRVIGARSTSSFTETIVHF